MTPYENHSVEALQTELSDIKKLKVLVKNMSKPENFTYIDVLNLHSHLDELERCLRETLREKSV